MKREKLRASPAKFSPSQLKHAELANATQPRGRADGGQEGGEEGREEEVLPFLTLTFCTSTLIWGAQCTRPLLCPRGS